MNCTSLTSLLDEHGAGWLGDAALLRAAEAHCEKCEDCRAALTAQQALAADLVPTPVALAQRVRRLTPAPRPRRTRVLPWLGAVAAIGGGIAFAGVGYYVVTGYQTDDGERDDRQSASGSITGVAADAAPAIQPEMESLTADSANAITAYVEAEEDRAVAAWSAGILGALPDGEYFALLQEAPVYPAAAAELGIEGEAISEFTITEAGDVEDVTIFESSDPVFDAPTIEATLRRKYKPRVVDGRGVTVSGVRNIFRYRLAAEAPESMTVEEVEDAARRAAEAVSRPPSDLDADQFAAELSAANECLYAGDLRCVELELDRIMATHQLSTAQTARLWHVYGFVHHRRGRYELAIEAYGRAAELGAIEPSYLNMMPLRIIAYIHYELGHYQEAMDAATEYVRLAPTVQAVDYIFIDRLRSLGAMEPVPATN